MAALMLAAFVVSIGYGIALPLLPYLIERLLGAGVVAAQVSRHTGLLTATYTLALFLFAPMWGRLSDRRGPHGVLLVGLLGFGVTMLAFSFVESLRIRFAGLVFGRMVGGRWRGGGGVSFGLSAAGGGGSFCPRCRLPPGKGGGSQKEGGKKKAAGP